MVTVSARIVLAHFEHIRDRSAAELHRGFRIVYDHHASVVGEPPFDDRLPPDANLVAWRFVAQNSRELARGCYFFPDEVRALKHATAVRARSAELVMQTIPRIGQRGFGWYATLDGRPAAMCARAFQSRSVARSAAARALGLLARVDEGDATTAAREAPSPVT